MENMPTPESSVIELFKQIPGTEKRDIPEAFIALAEDAVTRLREENENGQAA